MLHCGEWERGFSEDLPKNMEMSKLALKLTFSYQYIINHRRTMQIHLAHIEWICCTQECFLRGSIYHYKWINFLFSPVWWILSLWVYPWQIDISQPWNTDGQQPRLWYSHSGSGDTVTWPFSRDTHWDIDFGHPRDFHQFSFIAYLRPNSLVDPLKLIISKWNL